MTRRLSLIALLLLCGCTDDTRDAMTFSCISDEGDQAETAREVLFYFERGFLFLQGEAGRAENVCTQDGTIDCEVKMSDTALTLRQIVEKPQCRFRTTARTTLDIDRVSGEFQLTQEACEPSGDMVITGICQSR